MVKNVEGIGLKETYALNVQQVTALEIKAATDRAQQAQDEALYHLIDDVAHQVTGGKPSIPLSQEQKDDVVKAVTVQIFSP